MTYLDESADLYTQAIFGQNAQRVPAWWYVQDQGPGIVSFVGGSRGPKAHSMRLGSERTHQFCVGEIIVRPSIVIATDALQGSGIASLVMGAHDIKHMLSDGELILGQDEVRRLTSDPDTIPRHP